MEIKNKKMSSDKGGQQRCLCITKVRNSEGHQKDVLYPLLTKSLTEESQFSWFLLLFSAIATHFSVDEKSCSSLHIRFDRLSPRTKSRRRKVEKRKKKKVENPKK
jgi:hypothetical protein